jgi:hypothetical protein
MKLVQDWREGWKWISTQSMALAVAVLSTWEVIPEEWKAAISVSDVRPLVIALLVLGILGRFLDQTTPQEPSLPDEDAPQ